MVPQVNQMLTLPAWLQTLLDRVFNTRAYSTPVSRYRALAVYATLALVFTFYILGATLSADWYIPETGEHLSLAQLSLQYPASAPALTFFAALIMSVAIYALNRRGNRTVASWLLLALWYIAGVALSIAFTRIPSESDAPAMLLICMGAVLLGRVGVLVTGVVSVASLVLRSLTLTDYGSNSSVSLFTVILFVSATAFLVELLMRYARVTRSEGANEAVQNRELTNELLTQIAQYVAVRAPLQDLLSAIVERINQNFDFVYHVQVFLINERNDQAELVASTGEIGQQLIDQGHSLGVGSQSVIGQVTQSGETIIQRAGALNSVHRPNELLPETVVEAAFPLKVGNRVIGALDVQSKQANALESDDLVATFEAFANSVTLAIDNVRQFERAETRLEENERLVNDYKNTLAEVERLNDVLTGRAWSEYLLTASGRFSREFDVNREQFSDEDSASPNLLAAIRDDHMIQETQGNQRTISVPLRVRGQVIGAMEFELDEHRKIAPEDYELLQEISERFGLTVENARLVHESRRLAQREAIVNQISSRLQLTNNVDGMLNEAARGLRNALKAKRVAIRLGEPTEQGEPS